MPNRLADESSPYLLQHANNPVNWYPWGDEALARSREEDKPIFLSIGYSACHWCHVMEHESFENEQIAAYLNQHFVSIKVDREERPDLDHIYMQGVMALRQGQGGWPLSAFLAPDQQIFFGGTYWPPTSRQGMPGFDHVLKMVVEAFATKREQIREQSSQLTQILNDNSQQSENVDVNIGLLDIAARTLEQSFDFTHGGFGSAPKFPHSMDLQLLMRLAERASDEIHVSSQRMLEMVQLTLEKMYRGGIYDHLAGGFARYSVDELWLVPHFEKMLYDNALLTDAYLDALLLTGNPLFKTVAKETLDYTLAYMTDAAGGFHSTEDADSEGVEGKFYVWTPAGIREVLGEKVGDRFCNVYDVSDAGNFEGSNILNLKRTVEQTAATIETDAGQLKTELEASKQLLLKVRDQRIRPGKDDKILTSWNGLMIHSMARASLILDEDRYLNAAVAAADFVLSELRSDDGRLLRSWRHGTAKLNAYLDDHTYLINALITLYETTFDARWFSEAIALADVVLDKFADSDSGGFYFIADDHEQLIARMKEYQDSSIPSGNSMAAYALARIGNLTGDDRYTQAARDTIASCSSMLARSPAAFGQMLIVVDLMQRPIRQAVIAADSATDARRLLRAARSTNSRGRISACTTFAFAPPEDSDEYGRLPTQLQKLLSGRKMIDGKPSLYVCESFACQQPIVGETEIIKALSDTA